MGTEWHYESAEDLEQTLAERLRGFPREPDMLVYGLRAAVATCARAWLRAYHRLRVTGRENLPESGSFVLVANHSSHLDALCLLAALPLRSLHRAFPAAAADYFFVSLPRAALTAVLVNALPFQRSSGVRQSLALCRELLGNPGNILILFPEGTRSPDGETGRFKPGVGLVLAGQEVPAVPCRLVGAFSAWPKGTVVPRPRPVEVVIGKPLTFIDRDRSLAVAREIASELRDAVIALPS